MHGITSPHQHLTSTVGTVARPPISRRQLKAILLEQANVDSYEREGGSRLMALDHHAVMRAVAARGFSVRAWDVLTMQNELIDRCWGRSGKKPAEPQPRGERTGPRNIRPERLSLETRSRRDTNKAIVAIHQLLKTTKVSAPNDQASLADVGDPRGRSAAFEAVRFDFSGSKLKPEIDGRAIDRLEVRIGSMSKSLMIVARTADGGRLEGAVPSELSPKVMGANKKLFAQLLELGASFPGGSFEYDKSKALHETRTFTDKDWDGEMTVEGTKDVYDTKVYPAITDAVEHLVDSGALPKNPVIFDVGCGRGELTCRLARLLPHAKLFGGEYNAPSLGAAQESGSKLKNQPNFFHLDAINELTATAKERGILPDVIVMSGFIAKVVLEPEQGRKVMQQVFDLLPPGGLVVLAQKTDNLFNAEDFKSLGFEVLNTWSPKFDRCCYISRKPLGEL